LRINTEKSFLSTRFLILKLFAINNCYFSLRKLTVNLSIKVKFTSWFLQESIIFRADCGGPASKVNLLTPQTWEMSLPFSMTSISSYIGYPHTLRMQVGKLPIRGNIRADTECFRKAWTNFERSLKCL
jgi:hypothetical protein